MLTIILRAKMWTELARKLACTSWPWVESENCATEIVKLNSRYIELSNLCLISWLQCANFPHWKLDELDITKHEKK